MSAVITSTPIAVAHRDEGFLSAGISASATTITIGSIKKWVNGVETTGGFNTTGGFAEITISDRFELISFGTISVNSTTNVTTLTDVRRGLSVTATTQSLAAGTGIAWPKGATIRVVLSANYTQHGVFKDVANTYTALQTFDTVEFATSGNEYLKLASLTTTERNALTAANGMIIYNETTGVINSREGGAWVTSTSGTVVNASESAAGKVEISTPTENAAATSAGGSGALLVPHVADMVQVSGDSGVTAGAIPVLNSSSFVDTTLGGTSRGTHTAYAVICGGTTSTAAQQSIAAVGSSGQILTSNGSSALPTFQADPDANRGVFLYSNTADSSAVGASSTSENFFNRTFDIPANTLAAGDIIHVVCDITSPGSVGTTTIRYKWDSVLISSVAHSGAESVNITATTVVRTIGSSGTLATTITFITEDATSKVTREYVTDTVDTTQDLTVRFSAQEASSDGGNSNTLRILTITKFNSA